MLLITLAFWVLPASAEQLVRVGAYHSPPYVIKPESASPGGLLPELLAALNAAQSDYRFVLLPTSVTRRYRDMARARYDLILFESLEWGWQGTSLDALDLQIDDAEVYVTRAQPGRDQRFFERLGSKRIALNYGYHYAFADYNADQEYLKRTFNAVFSYSYDSNLLMLLNDRVELGVMTRSYLHHYRRENPQQGRQLLVSERADQVYRLHALLRPQAPIDGLRFSELLGRLQQSGELEVLLQRYQLSRTIGPGSERADPILR